MGEAMLGTEAFINRVVDYTEYLSENQNNEELEIIEESSETESAIGETLATDSEKELSNPIIAQTSEKSTPKGQFSLKENSSYAKKPTSYTKAEAEAMVNGIMESLLSLSHFFIFADFI